MSKVLFIQPHKMFLKSGLNSQESKFLSEKTDKFARVSPSIPAMTVLGVLTDHECYFLDATADNPSNIFEYNEKINLIGMPDEEILDEISEINPNVILITSMFSAEYFSVNRLIRILKSKSKTPIIVGGHQATLRPDWHLEAGADLIALGEGEPLIEKIIREESWNRNKIQKVDGRLNSLDNGWDISAVLKRFDGTNRYPLSITTRNPKLYLPEHIDFDDNTGVLYFSRGCPYDCKYCNATERDGRKIRHMSLEKMISITNEFMSLGVSTLRNEADTFGISRLDREYLKWIAEQRSNGREINLINTNSFFAKYFFQNGKFISERVDLLKNAGFKAITISIESFNERYNNGKLKGITLSMFQDCFNYIKQQGLNLDIYMMYLFPEQTLDELKQDIVKTNAVANIADAITWRALMYFPGTFYYDWAVRNRKFSENEYKKDLEKGYSFYKINKKYNFSQIKNPPQL